MSINMAGTRLDIAELYRWWDVLRSGGQLTEIRLIANDGRTASGIFDNIENIITAITPYTNDWNIYYTINRLNEDVRGLPQYNKIIVRPKQTCNDATITVRDYVCIDLDSVRLSGTNATEEQLEYTKKTANEVYKFLVNAGFNPSTVVFSGNGVHIYIRCAMINNEKNTQLVKRFLNALAMMFTDEHTDVDRTVFNSGRIMRLPSSYSCKGNTLDATRPQRLCKFVKIPVEQKVNDIAYFEKIAQLYPEDQRPTRENNYSTERFNLDDFIAKHNIEVTKVESVANGKKYILKHCPWNPAHTGKDAVLFQRDSGEIAFHCFHASDADKGWREFRSFYDPQAYARTQYNTKPRYDRWRETREPFVPVAENEEKGKKWLQMSDIKRVDITELMSIPTGFHEIDKKIVGLFAGDLTVLSGLSASGKTSWLDCLALNVVEQGYKVAIWSGEMQDWRFQGWIDQIAAGKGYTRRKEGYDNLYYVPKNISEKIASWLDDKLYLYNNDYGNRFFQLFNDIKELVEEKKVQLIILDNLAALSIDDYDSDKYSNQSKFIYELKDYAKKKNIHILLVAHPRKQNFFLRREGISGSADLSNIADNVILIHRVGKDFETRAKEFFGEDQVTMYMNYSTILEVSKNRSMGVTDFITGLYYEPESRRLKNSIAENVIYGWYEQPVQSAIFDGSGEFDIPMVDDVWKETYNFDGDEAPF